MFGASGTEDGRYVTMSFSKDTGKNNLLWIADVKESEIGPEMKWHKVGLFTITPSCHVADRIFLELGCQ